MSFTNPRRTSPVTPAKVDKGNALGIQTNMTLKKGATFHHSPTSPSSESLPFRVPSLPRRSNTNLDDVVGAHRRRVALTLDSIDRTLSLANKSSSSTSPSTIRSLRDNSQPFALGILDHDLEDSTMAQPKQEPERRVLRPRHNRRSSRHHASDSGLGTSIASTHEKLDAAEKEAKAALSGSAVTRSAAASSSEVEKLPSLSVKATNRIHEHILKPLLAKPSLKDFRPVVLDCPRRIQEKEILCLRDLEKTLLLTAPSASKTSSLYLDFCLTTIHCIQATVEYLNDREQTRPHDRPYTNGYFIDLVEQIRQYARQIADSKEKDNEEEGDEMDVDASDEVKLHGGINVNGQPAELIRVKKDGTAYSMATGLPVDDYEDDDKSPIKFKRSLSEQLEDEDEIMRSMARRKKNATAAELAPKRCREPGCNKEFKRPCDLTKHEKTHSRPWKCPVPSCKYHDYGWPTEKEMDRHHNDKHSSAPPMYECWYKPCPYKSKRESNCKQHMEKAHGWTYVRTKTNGKKSGSKSNTAEPTPVIGNLPTPKSGHLTGVATPPEDHIGMFPSENFLFPSYPANDAHPLNPPELRGFLPHDITDINLDLSPVETGTPSTESGNDNGFYQDMGVDLEIDEDIYSATAHIPEVRNPASIFAKSVVPPFAAAYEASAPVTSYDAQPSTAAHISPIGEGNLMLFTPKSLIDEGFADDFNPMGTGADFLLFDQVSSTKSGALGSFPEIPMSVEIPSMAAGYSQPSTQDFFQAPMDWSNDSHYYSEH